MMTAAGKLIFMRFRPLWGGLRAPHPRRSGMYAGAQPRVSRRPCACAFFNRPDGVHAAFGQCQAVLGRHADVQNVGGIRRGRPVLHRFGGRADGLDGLVVPVVGFRLSNAPVTVTSRPQVPGAQNNEVLTALGFTAAEIEQFKASGVV